MGKVLGQTMKSAPSCNSASQTADEKIEEASRIADADMARSGKEYSNDPVAVKKFLCGIADKIEESLRDSGRPGTAG
jgi:hypothetical protein